MKRKVLALSVLSLVATLIRVPAASVEGVASTSTTVGVPLVVHERPSEAHIRDLEYWSGIMSVMYIETAPDWPEWHLLGVCETGNQGKHLDRGYPPNEPYWEHRTDSYGGGLGMADVAWIEYGGKEFAESGDLATVAEQITVARRLRDGWNGKRAGGYGSWGCGRSLNLRR